MRSEYLKSVLRQEVGFFDTQTAGSSTTYQVVSILSSDANAVQVALCEKVGFQTHLSWSFWPSKNRATVNDKMSLGTDLSYTHSFNTFFFFPL